MSSLDQPDPFWPLLDSLRGLSDTGEHGFEGMLRDAVTKVTGRQLRLVKSGPQGGVDMGTDPSQVDPAIAIEAKRYGAKTRLGLVQLKPKLIDAVHQRPWLDFIVFGATQEITRGDREDLHNLGDENGIGVVFIDWPHFSMQLPPLAVLCALAPESLLDRIGHTSEVQSSLQAVCEQANFESARTDLVTRLTQPDLGWCAARRVMADWLRKAFQDRNTALAKLHTPVNLLDSTIHRIPRPGLNEALNRWWENRGGPLALLGEEGVGKSWATLAWWHEKADQDGSGLPLTLMIPAREFADADVEMLVSRLLMRRTGLRDEEFWRRRVALWLKTPTKDPRFLLIFDGLNQQWTFRDWRRVLVQLAADPWADKAPVILTCRPDYWTHELQDFAGLKPAPVRQEVDRFDDSELDALLASHGLTRDDFVPDLFSLLRVPRLCDLAIRHREAMAESGDITRERLIYEDWKDRLGRKSGHSMIGDPEFKAFIAGLGQRLQHQLGRGVETLSLTRRELTAELGADSGRGPESLYDTVSEIVDGRWMPLVPDRVNRFRLNKDLMPFALGMALVNMLKETPEGGQTDSLAEFLEPVGEQDLAVALLRAAVTFALKDPNCSEPQRRLLLDSWFRRQNFRQGDFEVFWRLLPSDVNLFFSLAEGQWMHSQGGHHEDEILIKGFANAAKRSPAVREQVLTWCATWLGTYWGDPFEGMVLNYDPNKQGVAERREQTRGRRAEWDEVAGLLTPPIPIRDDIDGNIVWLVCRVLGILSYLPREQSVPGITAWAVSRAIMGKDLQFDQVAWLLRLPHADDAEDVRRAIQHEAQRLRSLDRPVATEAARLLLEALATSDVAWQAPTPSCEVPGRPGWSSTVSVDEANGLLHWDREATRTRSQSDEAPLFAACDLDHYALNPDHHLSLDDVTVLRRLAEDTQTGSLWQVMGSTSNDIALEGAEAALARWAPEALGALYRRVFADAPLRTGEALIQLGFRTPSHLLVLTERERTAMGTSASWSSANENRAYCANLRLRLAELAERSASEQIEVFAHWPDGPNFDRKHQCILASPTHDDFVTIADQLRPDAPTQRLCGWLWYLSHVPLDDLPSGFPAIVPLLNHPDVRVRQLALEVAHKSGDPQLARALVENQWRWTQGMDREEGINGSLALIGAADQRMVAEIRERINPEAWGFLAIRDGATDDDLDTFAVLVRRRIEDDLSGQRPSRTLHRRYFILDRPVDQLVALRGDQVVSWLEPLLSRAQKPHSSLFMMEAFPYINLCRALLHHRPADGAALWHVIRELCDRDNFNSKALSHLPFEVPASEPVFELRHLACDEAMTDEDLGKIATLVITHNIQEWLIARIHQDLGGALAGQMARGLWLAGLLDATPAAECLWQTALVQAPASGWLARVYEQARHRYRRNRWARQWLEEFLTDRNRDRAFGRHLLFLRSADRRAFGWAPRRVDKAWHILPKSWQTHWSVRWPELKSAVEEQDKEGKKTLFGSKVTSHIQWPWR